MAPDLGASDACSRAYDTASARSTANCSATPAAVCGRVTAMCRALGYCWPLNRHPRPRMKSFTWYTSNSSEVKENKKVGEPRIRRYGWDRIVFYIAADTEKICLA